MTRNRKFESISLQRGVCKLSVPLALSRCARETNLRQPLWTYVRGESGGRHDLLLDRKRQAQRSQSAALLCQRARPHCGPPDPLRTYIIGNDGITLCREAPATVNDGQITVASNEELHTAPLSGKRLLALWNALPGVEKRTKVGDRKALINDLWSAIEGLPEPEPEADGKRPSKRDEVIAMLRRPEGATVYEWQAPLVG